MGSTFSVGGLVSGLDTKTIIAQLMQLERIPVKQLAARQDQLRKVDSAWQSVTTRLSALRASAVDPLRKENVWNGWYRATSSNNDVVAASVSGTPSTGATSFTVNRLAFAAQMASGDTFSGLSASMGSRALTIDFADGTAPLTVTSDASTTLTSFVERINAANKPVSAQAVKISDGSYRLVLTAKNTGVANNFTLSGVTGWTGPFTSVQNAQDSEITFGGTTPLTVTRSSNVITDLIEGVRLELKSTSATAVTITTQRNPDAPASVVKKLVDELTATLSALKDLTKYDPKANRGGPLTGDSTARRITQSLLATMSDTISGLTGNYTNANVLGISLTKDGLVTFDEAKFRAALEVDFVAVQKAFTRSATATDSRVKFVDGSDATQPGTYAITVTQAARVAERTGVAYTAPTGPMTLAISVSGKVVNVALDTAHDTVAKAVDAINTKLKADGETTLAAEVSGTAIKLATSVHGSAVSFTVATSGGTANQFGLDGTFTGQDASAQIGGETITGKGQLLTGATGNTEGLSVRITATQAEVEAASGSLNLGSITFTRGLAGQLSSVLTEFEGTTGAVATTVTRIKDQIALYQGRIDRFEVRLAAREALLVRQFAAMEAALGQLTSQGNYLASQLANLNNNRIKQ